MNRPADLSAALHSLRGDAHRPVIHFFEKHEEAIRHLNREEFFELLQYYLDALFACGEYARYLQRVEEALLLALDTRVHTIKGEEVFHHLLFRKAASAYHLGKSEQTRHLLRELLRLNPHHRLARRFLIRCLSDGQTATRQVVRAVSILLFLATAGIIAVEVFWVRPFYPEWIARVEALRIAGFALGLAVWLIGEAAIYAMARRQARQPGLRPVRHQQTPSSHPWP